MKETTMAEKKEAKQPPGIEEKRLPTEDEIRTGTFEVAFTNWR
jgi:hypothetical protein